MKYSDRNFFLQNSMKDRLTHFNTSVKEIKVKWEIIRIHKKPLTYVSPVKFCGRLRV